MLSRLNTILLTREIAMTKRLVNYNYMQTDSETKYIGFEVNSPREQINTVSSFIDGTSIYGPSKSVADKLRTFENGSLKVYH